MDKKGLIFFKGCWTPVDEAVGVLANRGLFFGESPFSTTRIIKGEALFLMRHLKRLNLSCKHLFNESIDEHNLKDELYKALGDLDLEDTSDFYLRITCVKGLFDKVETFFYLAPFVFESKGIKLTRSESVIGTSLVPSFLKTGNYLNTSFEINKAKERKFDDVIFFNYKDEVLEASTSNIFIVKSGVVLTPYLRSGILDGVMRNEVIDQLLEMNIPLKETNLVERDLLEADEIWLSNSLRLLRYSSCYKDKKLDNRLYNIVRNKFSKKLGF